ncbi:hypothetical protein O9X98_14410 [Agrobacterium salinitolerans]|nr:hypothetical protein [Agrobacterium salinitolerans]
MAETRANFWLFRPLDCHFGEQQAFRYGNSTAARRRRFQADSQPMDGNDFRSTKIAVLSRKKL